MIIIRNESSAALVVALVVLLYLIERVTTGGVVRRGCALPTHERRRYSALVYMITVRTCFILMIGDSVR
jgi:hypothetical protein